jgi:hypothetical protein
MVWLYKKHVTSYMHAMIYHVLTFLKTYRTVKIFNGQDVQKTRGGDTGGVVGGTPPPPPHSSVNGQIIISVGKTVLAKDNH